MGYSFCKYTLKKNYKIFILCFQSALLISTFGKTFDEELNYDDLQAELVEESRIYLKMKTYNSLLNDYRHNPIILDSQKKKFDKYIDKLPDEDIIKDIKNVINVDISMENIVDKSYKDVDNIYKDIILHELFEHIRFLIEHTIPIGAYWNEVLKFALDTVVRIYRTFVY